MGRPSYKTVQNLQMGGHGVDGGRQCDDTVEMHQLLRESKRTRQGGGMFIVGGFDWRRMVVVVRVASIGAEWWLWLQVTLIGVEGWTLVVQNERERERGVCRAHCTLLSASNHPRTNGIV